MSNTIARNTSANDRPFAVVFATGFTAAAVQTLFLREYLTVFSGNEIVIGAILALWLGATAVGSIVGGRAAFNNQTRHLLVYFFSIIVGLLALRSVRLWYGPGELVQPLMLLITILGTQSLPAFFGGYFFSSLSRIAPGEKLYTTENAGAAAGLSVVSICILLHAPNGISIAIILVVMAVVAIRHVWLLCGLFIVIAAFVIVDPVSVRWKYGPNVRTVTSGWEGEFAEIGDGEKHTLLNNLVYRSSSALPMIEQSVHLPVAMHDNIVRRALVIGNSGQVAELRKYDDVVIECLETEPILATGWCRCAASETFRSPRPFDVVLLGAGLPRTIGMSRFYTLSFFKKMRTLTGRDGVFSFTLPFSENYLSPPEQRLKDLLQATLGKVFSNVTIVPGSGYTFAASDRPLRWPVHCAVKTDYLETYTLASLTPDRTDRANRMHDSSTINTLNKPLALVFAQEQWLELFGVNRTIAGGIGALLFLIAIPVVMRSRAALSVGTSGFAAGVYSVVLLLMYQAAWGTLYSRISLLLIALSVGFALGGRMKKFPASDWVIAVYTALTLLVMANIASPPLAVFLVFHAGMGFLTGAQFATRPKITSWGGLYAADLVGGAFGMALGGAVLLPLFGVSAIAAGLGIVKGFSAIVGQNK